jgi:hypothetical protein
MRCSIEVVVLPVADVERALAFYTEKAGLTLNVDYAPTRRVPRRAADASRLGLLDQHKFPVAGWRGDFEPGLNPNRTDYASFAVQADDSLSFLETKRSLMQRWLADGRCDLARAERQATWTAERIRLPAARPLAEPLLAENA